MNKSDLVAALGDKKNLTEKQAMEIVNLVFNGLSETLKKAVELKSGILAFSLFGNIKLIKEGILKQENL